MARINEQETVMTVSLSFATRFAGALFLSAGLAFLLQPSPGHAAGGGGDEDTEASSSNAEPTMDDLIDDAEDHIDDEEYWEAIALLEQVRAQEPDNADVLNYLGYSHRKLGDHVTALDFYTAALAQEPNHLGANEYLGELYLEMNDLPKAEERLAVLAAACDSDCDEYEDLAEAIDEFKTANGAS
jgi:tetratricopeptide (TPR) repeat protein